MKTQVGATFPESSLYIYNEGNMEKTNTNRIFLKKKNSAFWDARGFYTNMLQLSYTKYN